MTDLTDRVELVDGPRRTWRDDLPVAAVAAGSAALVWVAGRAAGVAIEVQEGAGTRSVGVVSVVVTAVVVTLTAGALLRVMSRRRQRRRWWTVVALGVLALSMLGPLSAVSATAGLVLATMHAVVAGVVVIGLRRRALA
ncbi:DUF6069 family protein [Nocardioides sp.]|uniref:DUF6069 family protein n=1 Tax=Nocardioides sp. TaxID=35761 RepID=UPI003784A367